MMDLKNHCLFCLERTVPYSVIPSSRNGDDKGGGGVVAGGADGEEIAPPPDFQSLCMYLKIKLPKKEKGYEVLSSSCDKFLCISCFEMVDQLNRLNKEMMAIQRRIREVILAHDISANLPSGNKARRKTFEKELGAVTRGKRRSQGKDCLSFVEMFQTMVRGSNEVVINTEKEPAQTTNASSSRGSRKTRTRVITDEPVMVRSDTRMDPVPAAMKIEVDVENLNDCEEEEDPDLFTEPHSSSPHGNEVLEQNEDFETARKRIEAPVKSEEEDDEWNPEIKRRKRSKRKSVQPQNPRKPSKKRQTTSEMSILPKFKCTECDLTFTTWKRRTEHRQKSHSQKTTTLKSLLTSIPEAPSDTSGTSTARRKRGVSIHICTICGKHVKERSRFKLLNYMEHMLSHDKESIPDEANPHSCIACDKQFNLKINLELHIACHHETGQPIIRCDLCSEKLNYGTREALIEHLKSTHGETVYSCKHCPKSHVSFEKLLLHMINHRASKSLSCPECVAVCTSLKELQVHCYQAHPELKEKFSCERCDKVYLSTPSLRHHMERDHGFDRKSNTFNEELTDFNLTCPHCPPKGTVRIYKTALALNRHIRVYHEQKKKFKCDQCDNSFYSKANLQKHVENSHDKIRYPCPECGKTYSEQFSLTYHMKTHTGEGLLTCDVCSKQFPRMLQLKSHMRVHDTSEPDPEEKVFCEDCGKEFPNEYRLTKHRQNVHPKASKECHVCGLIFKRSDHLKSHMRIHSGERPFQCPACKKGFNRRDIMRVHVKGVHKMEWAEAEEKYKDTGDA